MDTVHLAARISRNMVVDRLVIVDDALKLRFRVESRSTSTVSVSAVDSANGDLRRIHCLMDGESMDLLVDLGSQISITYSYAEYKRTLSRHKLRRADITLRGYGAAPIICFGYLEIPVEYGEIRIPSFRFYVAKRETAYWVSIYLTVSVFAFWNQVRLNALTDAYGETVQEHATPNSDMPESQYDQQVVMETKADSTCKSLTTVSLSEFPKLCKQFGIMSGFQHKPNVGPSVKPVRQPLRRLALALREPVSAEIKRMLERRQYRANRHFAVDLQYCGRAQTRQIGTCMC